MQVYPGTGGVDGEGARWVAVLGVGQEDGYAAGAGAVQGGVEGVAGVRAAVPQRRMLPTAGASICPGASTLVQGLPAA